MRDSRSPKVAEASTAQARKRLQREFMKALADDFEAHGAAAIAQARELAPAAYLSALIRLMPEQFEIARPLQDISDDELARIANAIRAAIDPLGSGAGVGDPPEPDAARAVRTIPEATGLPH